MPGFQEARVRVPTSKLGDLHEVLAIYAPYAKILGVEIISTERQQRALPAPPKTEVLPPTRGSIVSGHLTKAQHKVLTIIKNGAASQEAIMSITQTPPHSVSRVVNMLTEMGYVKGKDGNYHLSAKEVPSE